jgi:hypothetical protein
MLRACATAGMGRAATANNARRDNFMGSVPYLGPDVRARAGRVKPGVMRGAAYG